MRRIFTLFTLTRTLLPLLPRCLLLVRSAGGLRGQRANERLTLVLLVAAGGDVVGSSELGAQSLFFFLQTISDQKLDPHGLIT